MNHVPIAGNMKVQAVVRDYQRKEVVVPHPGIGDVFAKYPEVAASAVTEVYLAVYARWRRNPNAFYQAALASWSDLLEDCMNDMDTCNYVAPDQSHCTCGVYGSVCGHCRDLLNKDSYYSSACMEIGCNIVPNPQIDAILQLRGIPYVDLMDANTICIGIKGS